MMAPSTFHGSTLCSTVTGAASGPLDTSVRAAGVIAGGWESEISVIVSSVKKCGRLKWLKVPLHTFFAVGHQIYPTMCQTPHFGSLFDLHYTKLGLEREIATSDNSLRSSKWPGSTYNIYTTIYLRRWRKSDRAEGTTKAGKGRNIRGKDSYCTLRNWIGYKYTDISPYFYTPLLTTKQAIR